VAKDFKDGSNEGEASNSLDVLERVQGEMDEALDDLSAKLARVLAKQEYDHMQNYAHYVKKKERELKELIMELSERAKVSGGVKDKAIEALQRQVKRAEMNETKMDK